MKPAVFSWRFLALSCGLTALVALQACTGIGPGFGGHPVVPPDPATQASRAKALAQALPMPADQALRIEYLDWHDDARDRPVPAKLYLPAGATAQSPVPLVVVSHGLGGSREGYSYLGKFFAANGLATLHLHHVGSDRRVWQGNVLGLVGRLQNAAQEGEAIHRAKDVHFALDQMLQGPLAPMLDADRIALAGHSYGANTALLVAGAQVSRTVDGATRVVTLRDPRIRAAVMLSAPPFHGETDLNAILRPITIPTLHVTTLEDDIRIPGYRSGAQARVDVYEATGSAEKWLAVFKHGAHSVFTDRLNTIGSTGNGETNPAVKVATRELALDFLRRNLNMTAASASHQHTAATQWRERYRDLLSRLEMGRS